ncbi:MAG TPA: DUF2442 domain-containing protein [Bacteroidia bacterium]|jgi:hypothetical protein|nr:DUF2442 domain-containing protein [Bacteroidia bacterium]
MIKAISVKALAPYKLHVTFNDGVEGTVDLSHLKDGEAFAFWQIPGNFEKVYLEGEAIAWNDNLDIDSLSLYLQLTGQTFAAFTAKQNSHA